MAERRDVRRAGTRHVVLPKELGLRAAGPYVAGIIYAVPPEEADRILSAKGFREATDAEIAAQEGGPRPGPELPPARPEIDARGGAAMTLETHTAAAPVPERGE